MNVETQNINRPLIITGLSGAGLSSVLKSLEDFDFEAFDNFPLSLVKPLVEDTQNPSALAIGIDTRTRGFSAEAVLKTANEINAFLIFITCDDAVLQKRFTETRRRHPMAKDAPLSVGIQKERKILKPLSEKADLVIDSSALSIHDLRHILEGHFNFREDKTLSVSLISFGFRNGLPREADIVMDVRFLKNPHWNEALKPKTGLDKDVGDYIQQDEKFDSFMENFKTLVTPLLPQYQREGKSYLTIGIGCTGGRHRSVFCIEKLRHWLSNQNITAHITHRDLKD